MNSIIYTFGILAILYLTAKAFAFAYEYAFALVIIWIVLFYELPFLFRHVLIWGGDPGEIARKDLMFNQKLHRYLLEQGRIRKSRFLRFFSRWQLEKVRQLEKANA